MSKRLLHPLSIALFFGCIAVPACAETLKSSGTCLEEYKSSKDAFIRVCRALPVGTPTSIFAAREAGRRSDAGTDKSLGPSLMFVALLAFLAFWMWLDFKKKEGRKGQVPSQVASPLNESAHASRPPEHQ